MGVFADWALSMHKNLCDVALGPKNYSAAELIEIEKKNRDKELDLVPKNVKKTQATLNVLKDGKLISCTPKTLALTTKKYFGDPQPFKTKSYSVEYEFKGFMVVFNVNCYLDKFNYPTDVKHLEVVYFKNGERKVTVQEGELAGRFAIYSNILEVLQNYLKATTTEKEETALNELLGEGEDSELDELL